MPPGIESDDYDLEGDNHFLEELLSNDSISLPENESSNFDHHDDPSCPRPPSEPPDVEIFFKPDSGVLITNVVKGDNHFLEELLSNDSISLPENESSNFDHHDDPSCPRPPSEPPDVEIFFKPDSGVLITNVVKGISEHYVLMPNILPTLPTFDPLYPVYNTLLLFSS
nr:hypothetical protein [Tanacetum cinerariifolium]